MDGPPLPLTLRAQSTVPLVGREEAWAALEQEWDEASSGARRVVLLAGEAGAGKSRLVAEFARHVHGRGATVLYGTCSDGVELPYGPVREAVDEYVASVGTGSLGDDLVDQLGPLLAAAPGRARAGMDLDERRVVAAAVTGLLEHITAERTALVVLDDMHWSDPATAALVEQLARGGRPRSCLVVVTHRTARADVTDPARRLLADLRRRPGTARIPVGPLDEDAVREFITAAAGHPLHLGLRAVVEMLSTESGGNPFFLGELWRHLIETGRLVRPHGRWRLEGALESGPTPSSVRDVVAARLGQLSDESRAAVQAAAVIGDVFDLRVLGAAIDRSPAEVLAALHPATELEMIDEFPPGTGRFSHGLVRRAAYDEQPAEARHQRHLDVARALEASGLAGIEVAVASHLVAAVPLVDRATAVSSASRAAAGAVGSGRYADAAAALGAALEVAGSGVVRAQLLLDHAEANMRAGDVAGAQASALDAHRVAVQAGDSPLVIRSAITFDEANWRAALPGQESQRVIETALADATDVGERLRLRAARARALALSGRDGEARAEAEDVLVQARAAGDVEAVRLGYMALLFTAWTPETIDRLLVAAREFVDLATSVGNREWELWALDKLLLGTITRGDLEAVREIAARHRSLADAVGQPLFRVLDLQLQSMLAVGEGRFTDAEALAAEALLQGVQLSGRDASGGYGVQMFSLRREQGRLDEAQDDVETLSSNGAGGTWLPALAVLTADIGMSERTTDILDELVATELRTLARDSLWPATLAYLTEAASAVGHAPAAARLLPELRPYSGLVIQAGTFLAAYGAADRYLGMLSSMLGLDHADERFEAALRLESRARMPVWLARTQAEYGHHLLRSGSAEAADRGAALLRFAGDAARRLGMVALSRSAEQASTGAWTSTRSRPPATADLTDRELAVLRLLVEGRSNRQIGQELSISHHTAANHVRSILLKAGCSNRTEAASWALRLGLISDA